MSLQLYDTLTREKRPFAPGDPRHVGMYVCGPTVYQRIHIGNARPLVVFDVLYRLLRHLFERVTYVRNITDIDDKIIDQAARNGEAIDVLTERTARAFHEDVAALLCLAPDHEPRATGHVEGMVSLIERLIERGHAYQAQGHVLFHVPSMPDYGALSGRPRDEQIAGARVEVAPYKRDPADFVLWKPSSASQPGWDSPWGRGRPGWHIECSAMAESLLGVPFDIHGGGIDLVFPHHENEIAQSRCARGLECMARFWVHNGFVDMRGHKMSKSLGNVLRMDDALAAVPGEAIRLWLLGTHYRSPIDCTDEALLEAKRQLDRFYGALDRTSADNAADDGHAEPDPQLVAALSDDLNTSLALSVLHELLNGLNRASGDERSRQAAALKASASLLGLLQDEPGRWLRAADEEKGTDEIERLIAERLEARKVRDFTRADEIRDRLAQEGIILEDGPKGTTWRRA